MEFLSCETDKTIVVARDNYYVNQNFVNGRVIEHDYQTVSMSKVVVAESERDWAVMAECDRWRT